MLTFALLILVNTSMNFAKSQFPQSPTMRPPVSDPPAPPVQPHPVKSIHQPIHTYIQFILIELSSLFSVDGRLFLQRLSKDSMNSAGTSNQNTCTVHGCITQKEVKKECGLIFSWIFHHIDTYDSFQVASLEYTELSWTCADNQTFAKRSFKLKPSMALLLHSP